MLSRVPALLWVALGPLAAQNGSLDRLPERSDLRWAISISPPVLSNFQRLRMRITIRIDGKEIESRKGRGEFVFAAEFRDASGNPFRTRTQVELSEYQKATSRHELECTLQAFVLPGDYRISLAVMESSTGQASVAHRAIHVSAPNNDPLPDAWRNLPAVEFIDAPDTPDLWFLPDERGRLALAAENRGPLRVEILANISPSEGSRRQGRAYDRNMISILPAMKILSRIALRSGTKNVTAVDVARRRVTYEQRDIESIDWPALKAALESQNPNKIDARSLRDRDQNAQFFIDQAVRRASPGGAGEPVLIVLSGPLVFATHQEMRPIEAPPKARVFYIRFQGITPAAFFASQGGGRDTAPRPLPSAFTDELERTLKPLQPRLFDIYSPGDFRKALAAILQEIEQ